MVPPIDTLQPAPPEEPAHERSNRAENHLSLPPFLRVPRLPAFIAAPYAYALPWLELVFGGLLMLGIWNRVSAGVATLIFLSILVAWLDAGNLLPRHMLMIYTPLAAWYFFEGPGRFSMDTVLSRRRV